MKQIDGACKIMTNQGDKQAIPRRPDSYYQFSSSSFDELKSNTQLQNDIKEHDTKIYPLIETCIKEDIRTSQCCQGHPEDGDKFGDITFEDPQCSKVKDIINYVSQKSIQYMVSYHNFGSTSDFGCSIRWPVEQTEQRAQELVNVINNKVKLDSSKTPEIIGLMEKLTHVFAKHNIETSIGRQGFSPKSSVGNITMIMRGHTPIVLSNEFIRVVKILDSTGFNKSVSVCYYEFKWDENLGDQKMCEVLNKIINMLEKNKKVDK